MKLEARMRLQAADLTFKDTTAQPMEREFANATSPGKDGAGNTVYYAQQANGFCCVLIVSRGGRLLAKSANNLTPGEAKAMAEHAVRSRLKRYLDADRAIERYTSYGSSRYKLLKSI